MSVSDKITQEEVTAAVEWLKGNILAKEAAAAMSCVQNSPGIYIRLSRALREAYRQGIVSCDDSIIANNNQ